MHFPSLRSLLYFWAHSTRIITLILRVYPENESSALNLSKLVPMLFSSRTKNSPQRFGNLFFPKKTEQIEIGQTASSKPFKGCRWNLLYFILN